VQRSFSLTAFSSHNDGPIVPGSSVDPTAKTQDGVVIPEESKTVLQTVYAAATNRMLRVAVNGFMESLGVVLAVMEELDVDVLAESGK
jgi:hypothetical protein